MMDSPLPTPDGTFGELPSEAAVPKPNRASREALAQADELLRTGERDRPIDQLVADLHHTAAIPVTRPEELPSEITLDPFYSPANQAHLAREAALMERGEGIIVKSLDELNAL
jgi:hypothetical protein